MSDKEYFIILPLLLYGLAIADLVNSWRSLLNKERRYIPYIVTSLILLEVAFSNFYQMHQWLTDDIFSSYLSYYRVLLPPLIFILIVAVLTPETEVTDIKGYFTKNIPIVFGGSALFVALHFLIEIQNGFAPRIVAIALLLAIAISGKVWLIYVLLLLRISILFIPGMN